ncbi:type VI secretion system Vgr family protein [Paraliomyxa miuraensis]|uniref:type VI secretion system Vgr family protein n=1 Tax=Paraliomyxa miuraensis TaxID=376150 RepID=UPI00224CB97E|nr:type VI secretion system tip protein TssI/VgrG [Paraliomyxa miuraensis]MCX4239739.1 type VI secretion system tip protein VgrG [Paraliomyxa miuraensis]
MPHDVIARNGLVGWIDDLPPVRFSLYLDLRGGGCEGQWEVRSFALDEGLHAPYGLSVLAVAPRAKLDLEALLGARAVFEIARGDQARAVHGVVIDAERVEGIEGLANEAGVEFHVVPAFALLGLSRRSRVFQGLSVVAIALAVMGPVLAEHGGAVCVDRLERRYGPRDYCVQYRETDLDFVLRILASEGITVMFDHGTGVETVVLIDGNQALPTAGREALEDHDEPPPRLPFVPEPADGLPIESVAAVGRQCRIRRRQWSATAWDWTTAPGFLQRSDTNAEHRATEGGWWEADEARPDEGQGVEPFPDGTQRRTDLRRQAELASATRLRASSNATILRAGSVFELLGAPSDELGETWVVTAIRHHGQAPPSSATATASESAEARYGNDVECQPLRAPVAPPRMPRPQVQGVCSAIVTGPPGETIHTDRFGRVRVRMLWDEQSHEDEPTSCWLRVATPWAGNGFGGVFVPRVGTEVIVTFIDGDPDRPLCIACVHGGGSMPPYALPEHATRTVLRTQTVGAAGFNELSFEDARGKEEVFLHAQGNLREQVLAHHSTEVGRNQTLSVDGSRYARIGKGDTTVTAGEHRHTVSGQVTEHYLGGYDLHVGKVSPDGKGPTGMTIDVASGGYELRSSEPIVLRCGDSRLELRPDGIVLQAPRISAGCPSTALVLEQDAATLRAAKKIELGTDMLVAVTASMAVLKGPATEIETTKLAIKGDEIEVESASRIGVRGRRVGIEADESIEIAATSRIGVRGRHVGIEADKRIGIETAGEVVIRGTDKIKLN